MTSFVLEYIYVMVYSFYRTLPITLSLHHLGSEVQLSSKGTSNYSADSLIRVLALVLCVDVQYAVIHRLFQLIPAVDMGQGENCLNFTTHRLQRCPMVKEV